MPEASTKHTCALALVSSHELPEAAGNTFEYLQKAGLICSLLQLLTFKVFSFSIMLACRDIF